MPPKKAPVASTKTAPLKKPVKPVAPAKKTVPATQKSNVTTSNQGKQSNQAKTTADQKAEQKAAPDAPKWTPQDTAARTIQCLVRRFLAEVRLQKLKKAKVDYEETMERLEKEAFVAIVRMEQEKLRKEQEKEDEERKKKLEEKKRINRMLEAAFEGDNYAITTVLREVEQVDDETGVAKDSYGMYVRKRHQQNMIDCRDANNNTPLSEASAGGHQSTITFLLEQGADVNSRGQFERTPLYRAAFAGNMAAAQVLLTQGADPRLYASDGLMPLHVAGSDPMKDLIENWDLELTDKLLESLAAEKNRRRQEDKETCSNQENRLENEVERLKKAYHACQKQLEKALCELNRRIYEHDKCVRKMQNKSEITLKAIEDAEDDVNRKQSEADTTKYKWDEAKIKLREQKKANQEQRKHSMFEVDNLPGEQIGVRELDDVLLRDVGNKIKSNPKWPLIIDIKGQASTFLRYRDTNYVLALSHVDMQTEAVRMALLGALRYGKPFVIDMMQVDMLETICDRLNEIHPQLSELLIQKQLQSNSNFKVLLKDTDSKEYRETNFLEDKLENFKFFLITKQAQPSEVLIDSFYCLRVHVPGADAFADID